MKSFILAASAASLARASGALGNLGNPNSGLAPTLDFLLPAGLDLFGDNGPLSPPSEGQTNVWHPPHEGVAIDDCDDSSNDDWHYVHPCGGCEEYDPPHVWTTSIVPATQTASVISCAPTGADCPSGQATVVIAVPESTTVCPVPVTNPYPVAEDDDDYYPPPAPVEGYPPPAGVTQPAAPGYPPPSQPVPPVAPGNPPPVAPPLTTPAAAPTGFPAPACSTGDNCRPIYSIPANQTYVNPPLRPTGCLGADCAAAPAPTGSPPQPVGPGAASGTGPAAGTAGVFPPAYPTYPAASGASKQSIGALLAGLVAVLVL